MESMQKPVVFEKWRWSFNDYTTKKTGLEHTHTQKNNEAAGLQKGAWNFSELEESGALYERFAKIIRSGQKIGMVEFGREGRQLLVVDLDLKYWPESEDGAVWSDELLENVGNHVATCILKHVAPTDDREAFTIHVQTRSQDVEGITPDSKDPTAYKNGIHIVTDIVLPKATDALYIRKEMIRQWNSLRDLLEEGGKRRLHTTDPETVIDKAVMGTNGWIVYGCSSDCRTPYMDRVDICVPWRGGDHSTMYCEWTSPTIIEGDGLLQKIIEYRIKRGSDEVNAILLPQEIGEEEKKMERPEKIARPVSSTTTAATATDITVPLVRIASSIEAKRADAYEDWMQVCFALKRTARDDVAAWRTAVHEFSRKCPGKYNSSKVDEWIESNKETQSELGPRFLMSILNQARVSAGEIIDLFTRTLPYNDRDIEPFLLPGSLVSALREELQRAVDAGFRTPTVGFNTSFENKSVTPELVGFRRLAADYCDIVGAEEKLDKRFNPPLAKLVWEEKQKDLNQKVVSIYMDFYYLLLFTGGSGFFVPKVYNESLKRFECKLDQTAGIPISSVYSAHRFRHTYMKEYLGVELYDPLVKKSSLAPSVYGVSLVVKYDRTVRYCPDSQQRFIERAGTGTRAVEEIKEFSTREKADLIEYHMRTVICGGDPVAWSALVRLLAAKFRWPMNKRSDGSPSGDWVLFIFGPEGCGKSAFFRKLYCTAFGEEYVVSNLDQSVLDPTAERSVLKSKLIAQIDELKPLLVKRDIDAFNTNLKQFVGQNTASYKQLYKDRTPSERTQSLIVITNEPNAVHISGAARRILAVAAPHSTRISTSYKAALFDHCLVDQEAVATVISDLLKAAEDETLPDAPETLARKAMRQSASHERFVFWLLEHGLNPRLGHRATEIVKQYHYWHENVLRNGRVAHDSATLLRELLSTPLIPRKERDSRSGRSYEIVTLSEQYIGNLAGLASSFNRSEEELVEIMTRYKWNLEAGREPIYICRVQRSDDPRDRNTKKPEEEWNRETGTSSDDSKNDPPAEVII